MVDRVTVYAGQVPLETDLLQMGQDYMVGIAKLSEAMLGITQQVAGFTCAPTAPASMAVVVSGGQIYQQENLEETAWSSLPADTTDTIVKQGIALAPTTLTLTAPTTTGYSQVYLVEAQYQDQDTGAVVRPYYNAANPDVPFSGPGNAGTADNTVRKGAAVLQLKAGTAATLGTQISPTPDAGWAPLFLITVAAGQTTVTSGNIATHPSAPFILPLSQIPGDVQSGEWLYAGTTTGSSTAFSAALSPVPGSFPAGMKVRCKMHAAPTGPSTLTMNSVAGAIQRRGGVALAGGEWNANDIIEFCQTGSGPWQINGLVATDIPVPASQPQQSYVHVGQDTGTANNIVASVTPAITSYQAEMIYVIKAAAAPTGASVANFSGLGNRTLLRHDGTAIQANDWAAGEPIMITDDGTNLRLAYVTQQYVKQLSPAGSTLISAFTAALAVSDIAVGPTNTTVLTSGSFTGATYADVRGGCAFRSYDESGDYVGYVAALQLNDVTASTSVLSANYQGAGSQLSGSDQVQVAVSVTDIFQGLNPTHVYTLSLVCHKNAAYGPVNVDDPRIFAQTDGH